MDLLDVARGPALVFALTVFTLGTLWRLVTVLRLPRMTDLSAPREGAPSNLNAAWTGIWRGLWPRRAFGAAAMGSTINGYVFHFGLALIFLGYAPHIEFIRRITGIGWPALPDSVMYIASGFTIISLLLALWFRLSDPVLRMRLGRRAACWAESYGWPVIADRLLTLFSDVSAVPVAAMAGCTA